MKKDLAIFMLAWALIISVQALAQKHTEGATEGALPPTSAFLPPVGQSVHYRFSDTLTTPKESKNEVGTLTLTAVNDSEIKATLTIDNKAPRNFSLHVDETGALRPAAEPDPPSAATRHNVQSEPGAAERALLLRLSLAAQIGAHPGEDMSIPVLLNVPWASGPVDPTLNIKSTSSDAFTGDASDTTTINPPQNRQPHILRSVAISAGAGIAAGEIGGTTGRIIRPIVAVSSILIATRSHSGPQSADVSLHISGQLSAGRLQRLSGNQEYTIAQKEHSRIFSDQWQLIAQ
jgi:hypothetical protein